MKTSNIDQTCRQTKLYWLSKPSLSERFALQCPNDQQSLPSSSPLSNWFQFSRENLSFTTREFTPSRETILVPREILRMLARGLVVLGLLFCFLARTCISSREVWCCSVSSRGLWNFLARYPEDLRAKSCSKTVKTTSLVNFAICVWSVPVSSYTFLSVNSPVFRHFSQTEDLCSSRRLVSSFD